MKRKLIILSISVFIIVFICIVSLNGKKSKKSESGKETGTENIEETESSEIITEETQTQTEPQTEPQIDVNKPMVAITFDDGPNKSTTSIILDALKKHNAHATFFVVGYSIDGNEEILKQMVQQGSQVGNHTAGHKKLTKITDDTEFDNEINSVKNKIIEITNQEVVPLRPPYGEADERVMSKISDPVILWSIDTEDWLTKNPTLVLENVQSNIFDGAIILMHDIYPESAEAAVKVIEWLDSQGYQMVTVSELGEYRRGGLVTGIKYGSLPPK